MKTDLLLCLFLAASLSVGGCSSKPAPKATLERGWIGGDFRPAGKELRPPGKSPKVYVRQVYPGTPGHSAGLQAGDLILAMDGNVVGSLDDFRAKVDAAKPGRSVDFHLLREGQETDVPVTVGRERYQRWKSVSFGLGLMTELDLVPDPDFRIGPVVAYKHTTDRRELNSPESKLEKAAHKPANDAPEGMSSSEGWNVWLAVFGFSGYKTILSQESVAVQQATSGPDQ